MAETDDFIPAHTSKWDSSTRAQYQAYVNATEARASVNSSSYIESDRIHAGDALIVEHPKGRMFAEAGANKSIKMQKKPLKMDLVVGQPFGAYFAAADDSLVPTASEPEPDTKITDASMVPSADNSELFDDGSNQKLSMEDIKKLKREKGNAPSELIAIIANNSATFANKTEFSQEKYLKRKKKKYTNTARVLRPSPRVLCDVYLSKTPAKILHLRPDTLAQLLAFSNVRANCQAVVVESCAGLVTAAVAERLGGFGHVLSAHDGNVPSLETLRKFGISEDVAKTVSHFPLSMLAQVQNKELKEPISTASSSSLSSSAAPMDTSEGNNSNSNKDSAANSNDSSASASSNSAGDHKESKYPDNDNNAKNESNDSSNLADDDTEMDSGDSAEASNSNSSSDSKSSKSSRSPAVQMKVAFDQLRNGRTDCLVIASRFSPEHLLFALLPLLANSGCFAVYCVNSEPLVRCQSRLHKEGGCAQLQLTESWLREYQVLPSRTHPMMRMNGTGGFLLSGVKAFQSSNAKSA